MLATSQLGITVASLLILNVSEPAIHHLLEVPLRLTGWPEQVIGTISFVIALLLVSFLHVVLGEMVPKNLSFSVPDRAVLMLAPPLVFVARMLRPIILALNAIARGVLRLFRVEPKRRGEQRVHARRGRDDRAAVDARGRAAPTRPARSPPRSSSPRRRCRTSRSASARSSPCPRMRPRPTSSARSPSTASRATSSWTTTASRPATSTSRTSSTSRTTTSSTEPVPPKRIRQLISVFRGTDLEDALATMRRSRRARRAGVRRERARRAGVLFLEDIIEELVGEVQDATRRSR